MPTCAHCKSKVESGERYITYGGLCWHSEVCLADYVMENDHRIDVEKKIREVEDGVKYHIAE